MEEFKIEHYEKSNSGKKFPIFKTLSSNEAERIYRKFSEIVGVSISNLQLVKTIDEMEYQIENVNADDNNFSFANILNYLNIIPKRKVYINWYRYDNIDEMFTEDFIRDFDDIWYPGPDDIDIFDGSFLWIISVCHEGYIKYIKF